MPTLDELLVRIDASTELLRREMAKGTGEVTKFERRTGRSLDKIDSRFSKLGKGIKTALGVFGVGASVVGLTAFAKSAIAAGDSIDKASKVAGVAAETIQELRFAFGQLAGTTDKEVDESLRRFNRRMGLAIQGTGEAKVAFKELGLQFRDTNGALRSTDAVLEDALKGLADIQSASVRAARASQLFGEDVGPRLSAAVGEGIEAMDAFRQATPGVLSSDQVAKAAALTDAFAAMARTVGGTLKGAFIDATYAVGDFFDLVEKGEELERLTSRLASVRKDISELEGKGGFTAGPLSRRREEERAILADISALKKRQQSVLEEIDPAPFIQRAANQNAGRQRAREITNRISGSLGSVSGTTSNDLSTISAAGYVQRGTDRGTALGQVRAQAREIAQSIGSISDESEVTVSKISEQWEDLGRSMNVSIKSSLVDAFLGIEADWGNMIKRMLAELAVSNLLNFAGGALGGGFGSFLTGLTGRAAGGPVTAGRPYLVNENTPRSEVFVPNASGRILTASQASRMGSGVTIQNNVDARGATDPAAVEVAVERAVARAVSISSENTKAAFKAFNRPGMA